MATDFVPRHPYVAVGRNGLLKVGHTVDVKKRVVQLKREFQRRGDELLQIEACACIEQSHTVELRLIWHCAKVFTRHSGREWFTGGDFAALVVMAHAETARLKDERYPRYTDEQIAGWRAQGAARQRQKAELAARRKARVARAAQQRYWKRSRSERAIGALVVFATAASRAHSPKPEPAMPGLAPALSEVGVHHKNENASCTGARR